MARFRKTSRSCGGAVAHLGLLGAVAVSAIAVLGVTAAVPAGATTSSAPAFSANATGEGLNLNLFGNKIVGGNSAVCVNAGGVSTNKDGNGVATHCDGLPSPESYGTGEGTLLTTSGLNGTATAEATSAGQSVSDPTDAPVSSHCSPLSTGTQGSSGLTFEFGVGCAWAIASEDGGGNPSASAHGDVANLKLDGAAIASALLSDGGSTVSGSSDLCNQDTSAPTGASTIGQLTNGLCQVLTSIGNGGASSAPAPVGGLFDGISQAIQNFYDVATNNDPDTTINVYVGPADSGVCQGTYSGAGSDGVFPNDEPGCEPHGGATNDGTVTVASSGSTVDVQLFPGVGCTEYDPSGAKTTLAECAANEAEYLTDEQNNPTATYLIDVKVGPATCSATRNPTTGEWTSSSYASLVDVDFNIPGDYYPLDIPGNTGAGPGEFPGISGTPLQSSLEVATGSAAPIGDSAGCAGDSLTLSLLENPSFPGGSTTQGGGAINLHVGSSTLTAANGGTTPAVVPASSPTGQSTPPCPSQPSLTTPCPVTPVAASTAAATAVHTGEWFAGSTPYLVGLAALGGGLIGWPRLRRMKLLTRLAHRAHR